MPLSKGSNLEMIINFNQSVSTTVYTNGVISSVNHQLQGSTNALIRANRPDTVGMNFTETLSLSIGQVMGKNAANDGPQLYTHPLKQCRLFLPEYVLSPDKLDSYLSGKNSVRKIVYEDVFVKHLVNLEAGSQIDASINTNASNFKQLIIIPMLSKTSNIVYAGFTKYTPQQSCYSQEPSVCSPYLISNFNVKVGTHNIYTSNMNYRHDNFMHELNGAQGVKGGLESGFKSGQISLKDYNKNFGYIVVDLTRKGFEDVDKLLNIEISGRIDSPKALDLLCYVVVQKEVIIDVATGGIIKK